MLELFAALAKLALYAGSFVGAGVAFARMSLGGRLGPSDDVAPKLMAVAAGAMLAAAIAGAVILIARLGGQVDSTTLSAIWETPAGPAIALQLTGATLLLLSAQTKGVMRVLQLGSGALALASFGINGHSASASVLTGAIAFLHVCAASWWLGALLLLHEAVRVLPEPDLALLVRRFSMFAVVIVGGLVVGGAFLTLTLLDFGRSEWLTPYMQALSMKILLAVSLLGIAVWNKFLITPRITAADGKGAQQLRQSIGIEIGLFASVFVATAWLTTFNSPHT
jgi:putative copper export protein